MKTMKRYNSDIVRCLLLVLIAFSTTYSHAGLPRIINPRMWNGQNVTWNDFQVRHIQTDTLKPSYISLDIEDELKVKWTGNTRFQYTDFTAYMYPTSSWYDPDKVTEWDLLSNNVLFDLVELHARMLQKEYNRSYDYVSRQQAKDHAWNEAQQRFREFELQTDYQRDTAALALFERNIQRELNMLPRTEPTLPPLDYRWHYGFQLGYWRMDPLKEARNDLSPINGFNFEFIAGHNRLEFGITIKSSSTDISQPAYFSDNDYVWRADEATLAINALNLGYRVYSGQYLRLVPFTNIGTATLMQKDPDFPDDYEKNHKEKGFNLDAGLNLDYVVMRDIRQLTNADEFFLRLKPYVSYTKIGGREIWSANVGISFCIDMIFLKNF
ncbi:MAG: hypothetical protein IKW84_10315 [Bacteroidaceae bacterium]|nr:hypothetical protein [Bacteroidaceae bacterium]